MRSRVLAVAVGPSVRLGVRPFAALSPGRWSGHNRLVKPHPTLGLVVAVLSSAACSSVSEISEGLVIAVAADPPTSLQRDADGNLIVGTDLGYLVTLTRAYLVSTSVEIFSCQATASRLWQRWIIGRAEAHAVGAPTRLGTAFVEALTGNGDVRHALGEIRPPPDRYCRIAYTASAADGDAIGMPPDRVATGNTVYLEGTFQRFPADPPRSFTVSSSAPFTVEGDVGVLDLAGSMPNPTLVIRKQADHWFDGVDFQIQPPRVVAKEILDNMRRSIRLERP
jgi:hypothetical protein